MISKYCCVSNFSVKSPTYPVLSYRILQTQYQRCTMIYEFAGRSVFYAQGKPSRIQSLILTTVLRRPSLGLILTTRSNVCDPPSRVPFSHGVYGLVNYGLRLLVLIEKHNGFFCSGEGIDLGARFLIYILEWFDSRSDANTRWLAIAS